ncbi:hypothetical protein C9J12_25665 [Photobacterium frigidiphilum]|uniref:Uncharacterized protein n=1 Tax=Photobacterium frigidiphilum TaxID=264736 RepID=A0A2T3J7Q5_9GAMM|nr:hypothetical protein [Photobacterium frigidiphilum]PSU44788.1 hypothetical protein C9J12_25665 [Photobacterium frigidiphilum]
MKKVKHVIYFAMLMAFTPSHAQMTAAQAMQESRDSISPPSYYNDANNTAWNNTLPREAVSGSATVTTYSVRNGTKKLKPTSSHICTSSRAYGYYHRGLKGIDVSVYQSGGYWYLKAASPNSDNIGNATCWNK